MSILIKQKIGRRSNLQEGELPFIITGTNDSNAAKLAMLEQAPGEYDGFGIVGAEVEELYEHSAADGIWEGRILYAPPETRLFEPGDTSFNFDTGGGTQHIQYSKYTRGVYRPGETASATTPAYRNMFDSAIGWDGQNIAGADQPVREFFFTETRLYSADQFTVDFIRSLWRLTGTVNNAPYTSLKMGEFELGELMLERAAGGGRGDGKVEISLQFHASANVKQFSVGSLTIGDGSAVVKYGFDYVWVKYVESEETARKTTVPKVEAVVIERIADLGDYSVIAGEPT